MTPKETTHAAILDAALTCARRTGLYTMTRRQVAKRARVAPATVSFHFVDMVELRRACVRYVIQHAMPLEVLAHALARRDPIAVKAPAEMKRAALDTLA